MGLVELITLVLFWQHGGGFPRPVQGASTTPVRGLLRRPFGRPRWSYAHPGPAGPVKDPEPSGTAEEPDDIETWYARPRRRRRQRRLAIAAALVTAAAVTWTAAGGWRASVRGEISGVSPTTGGGAHTAINRLFPSSFVADLYVVVPYDPHTFDHIPGPEPGAPGGVNLESIFGASGWVCTSATARHDVQAYGFVPLPACGSTS
jgi:hypothetical protein